MRQKQLQCVVTFKTTTQAMAFEDVARQGKLSGRLIPLPRLIGAGCGLAWREDPNNRVLIENLKIEYHLEYENIYEIII
ncbi:DUF3343 domain-containing protein [Niameybacter massiliensis]|uniref:DUF3343 domain-containing protein n=1 Tax=Niameybacter massiliensis TaxID=1658108 RepID=UPI0006B40BDA|nr:DUF3343 domain-containing protein [Niameybacter massiliensis]